VLSAGASRDVDVVAETDADAGAAVGARGTVRRSSSDGPDDEVGEGLAAASADDACSGVR